MVVIDDEEEQIFMNCEADFSFYRKQTLKNLFGFILYSLTLATAGLCLL